MERVVLSVLFVLKKKKCKRQTRIGMIVQMVEKEI